MLAGSPSYVHSYSPGDVHYGSGCVDALESKLEAEGWDRALVFCGRNVGSSPAVMDPVRDGIGDRLVHVCDRSTPEKHVETVYACTDLVEEHDVDVIVAVGGGSTLDMARAVRVLAASNRPRSELVDEIEATGTLSLPDAPLLPMIAVPTTLAGAELSTIGGARGAPEYPDRPTEDADDGVVIVDQRLMPSAVFYDPELFATTPDRILASSAMNGFDKAVEMLYSRRANPITDATALHALRLLRSGLPELVPDPRPDGAMDRSVSGVILAQYGLSTGGPGKISLIHAFGHGFSMQYEVQQGDVHGVFAPHVLRFVFDRIDGRRRLMAEALGHPVEDASEEELAEWVVESVTALRDELGLPARLRDLQGIERDHLPEVAERIHEDRGIDAIDLTPSRDDIDRLLNEAW